MSYLKGNTGDKSSKRLWGSIYLGYGLIMAAGGQFFGKDVSFDVWLAIVITGGSLLGIGLVELFSKAEIGKQATTTPTKPGSGKS